MIRSDIFLVHAARDNISAGEFAQALRAAGATVFYAQDSLDPGDAWDLTIPEAIRQSSMTLVLVGEHTEGSWYQRSEIVTAVEWAREQGVDHRIVPVLLMRQGRTPALPYGLDPLQAVTVRSPRDYARVARELVALVGVATASNSVQLLAADGALQLVRDQTHARLQDLVRSLPCPDASLSRAETTLWLQTLSAWDSSAHEVLDTVEKLARRVPRATDRQALRQAAVLVQRCLAKYERVTQLDPTRREARDQQRALAESLDDLADTVRA
jgi:hypothetical protein